MGPKNLINYNKFNKDIHQIRYQRRHILNLLILLRRLAIILLTPKAKMSPNLKKARTMARSLRDTERRLLRCNWIERCQEIKKSFTLWCRFRRYLIHPISLKTITIQTSKTTNLSYSIQKETRMTMMRRTLTATLVIWWRLILRSAKKK